MKKNCLGLKMKEFINCTIDYCYIDFILLLKMQHLNTTTKHGFSYNTKPGLILNYMCEANIVVSSIFMFPV